MADSLSKRAFIVGCGRSGTTLLQSLLGAHRAIKVLPETGFVAYTVGQTDRRILPESAWPHENMVKHTISDLRLGMGIAHDKSQSRFKRFFERIGRSELYDEMPHRTRTISGQIAAFSGVLDKLTIEDCKEFWIEKTPFHLFYMDSIEQHLKPVKFIHLVRNGPDVVASLYDAAGNFPNTVWAWFCDIDTCIGYWNKCIPFTRRSMQKPNHIAVSYEQLVEDPEYVLRKLCEFLETKYDENMLKDYKSVAKSITIGEPWKDKTSDVVHNANSTKFNSLFNEGQRHHIESALIQLDDREFYLS